MTSFSSLLKIIRSMNSFWFMSTIFYFLNNLAVTETFFLPKHFEPWIDSTIPIIVITLLLAWLWVSIIESQSGEDPVPHLPLFRKQIRQTWPIALAFLIIAQILHFALFLSGQPLPNLQLLTACLTVPLAYLAAGFIFKLKYKNLLSKKLVDPAISVDVALIGILFISALIGLAVLSLTIGNQAPILQPIVDIVSWQLSLVSFAFFAQTFLNANPEIPGQFKKDKTVILISLASGGIIIEPVVSLVLPFYPPFFCVLRALTPANYRVIEYNRAPWKEEYYQEGALVAISCFTPNCADAYKIAKEFRRRGSKVVMGGPHVTFFPEEALAFCDSVVIGFAESVWGTIVEDFEKGQLQRIYQGECSQEGLARTQEFLSTAPVENARFFIQANRGCKFNCYFCANPALNGKVNIQRSLENIIPLIKKVADKKHLITFLDNNMYTDPDYSKALFRAMIPLKTKWTGSISIDVARDDEALQLMKESGCQALLIGFEIAPGSSEQKKGGKYALADDYLMLSRKLQKKGIEIKAQLIFGFPGDSWQTLFHQWWFAFRMSPALTGLSLLTPLPGSRFFDDMAKQKKIANLNWREFDLFHQVFEHPILRRPLILEKGFMVLILFFFLTTSFLGRVLLGGVVAWKILPLLFKLII